MSSRTFRIPDGPSVADPAHVIAVDELIPIEGGVGKVIRYSDFTEIKEYIRKLELKDAENTGYARAYNEFCNRLGVTNPTELQDLIARLQKERQ
mgnify:CR=1 FL=1